MPKDSIYFDHNATTPLDEEVLEGMRPYLQDRFGNPSSVHQFGRAAKAGQEQARKQVARLIGAQPAEIIFTSGGTESVNLALKGLALAYRHRGRRIITSCIEHPAVLACSRWLEQQGFEVIRVPVDRYGVVKVEEVARAINKQTILISIMHANNEVGTIQPIEKIAHLARKHRVLLHTDAVQSVGKIPVQVDKLGVDALSLSGHKLYGPKGVGALYVRTGLDLCPLLLGGHQEQNRRAGTENVAGIVGLGAACEKAYMRLEQDRAYISQLRDKLWEGIKQQIKGVRLNGHPERCLPGTLNVSFNRISGELLLINLDLEGIAVSTGSACTSGTLEPSHVLAAMGLTHEEASSAIRISLGRNNTFRR